MHTKQSKIQSPKNIRVLGTRILMKVVQREEGLEKIHQNNVFKLFMDLPLVTTISVVSNQPKFEKVERKHFFVK